MKQNILEIQGLETCYGKIAALRSVSLSIAERSITCLLGPNGAGKTTLMMSIAGLLTPRAGSVKVAGRDIAGCRPYMAVRHGIALVPENRLVFPQMSVRDNLRAGAYSRRDKREIEADLDRMFKRFPVLLKKEKHQAGTLSGGEQQMLTIGRALMSRPKVLLMDEPSLGLAPLIVEEIFRMIKEINAEGTTIFLVEQNAHMALKISDRLYLIEQGQITFSGDPSQVSQNEIIHRAYLGSVGE